MYPFKIKDQRSGHLELGRLSDPQIPGLYRRHLLQIREHITLKSVPKTRPVLHGKYLINSIFTPILGKYDIPGTRLRNRVWTGNIGYYFRNQNRFHPLSNQHAKTTAKAKTHRTRNENIHGHAVQSPKTTRLVIQINSSKAMKEA